MGQPIELSDALVDEAQAAVPISRRSIAGQIEFWAGLGKSIEPLLRGRPVALQTTGADQPLSQCLLVVDTTVGRERVEATLSNRPFPHYKPVPGRADLLCRIEADGKETIGCFVGRNFHPIEVQN